MNERVRFLQRTILRPINEQELAHVDQLSRLRRHSRGTPIYLPAEDASDVMLLVSGRVKVCTLTSEGKQGILNIVESGQVFGEAALLESSLWEDYAEAMMDSVVLSIPREVFVGLMSRYPSVALAITQLIAFRRRRVERRLKYLLFRSNRQRLVHLLFDLVEDYGVRDAERIELDLRLSHQDLAGMIGSTRETVTVTLGELQREKSLLIRRRKLVITDPKKLATSIDVPAPYVVRRDRMTAHC